MTTTDRTITTGNPRPFSISVSDDDLDDLRRRLDAARLPAPLPGAPWSRGIDLEYLERLRQHWLTRYDWRTQEARLNSRPQFLVEIDGVDIHYWHLASTRPGATPLLLIHGWPGSPWEFDRIVEELTEPSVVGMPAFDVVVVALPGFGFGGKPTEEGWHLDRIADAFDALMVQVLHYDRYGVQGGDWGGLTASVMARHHEEHLTGIHLNLAFTSPPNDADPDELEAFTTAVQQFTAEEGGYRNVQGTKPLSLAVGLTDSPIGLAAWIVEKFHGWADIQAGLESVFDFDWLITNLMFYWAPKSAASSASLYYETAHGADFDISSPVHVPTGIIVFPYDDPMMTHTPRSWFEQRFQIVRFTTPKVGGHFAAVEQPGALVADIRSFFAAL